MVQRLDNAQGVALFRFKPDGFETGRSTHL
jgi:hypothetical protein